MVTINDYCYWRTLTCKSILSGRGGVHLFLFLNVFYHPDTDSAFLYTLVLLVSIEILHILFEFLQ